MGFSCCMPGSLLIFTAGLENLAILLSSFYRFQDTSCPGISVRFLPLTLFSKPLLIITTGISLLKTILSHSTDNGLDNSSSKIKGIFSYDFRS